MQDIAKKARPAAAGGDSPTLASQILGWLLPIALGAGAGLLVLFIWNQSLGPVHNLVDGFDVQDYDGNDALEEQLRDLGPSYRDDLLDEFLAVPDKWTEWKLWVGGVLGRDPRGGDLC